MGYKKTVFSTTSYYAGKVKDMEIPRTPKTELHAYVTPLPSDLSLTSGMNTQTMTFLSSLSTDKADARSSFQYGRDNADSLLETHKKVGTCKIHGYRKWIWKYIVKLVYSLFYVYLKWSCG